MTLIKNHRDDLIQQLESANNSQITLAGARYTPGTEQGAGAPNLEVTNLNALFEYLSISEKALDEIALISKGFQCQYLENKKEFFDLMILIRFSGEQLKQLSPYPLAARIFQVNNILKSSASELCYKTFLCN